MEATLKRSKAKGKRYALIVQQQDGKKKTINFGDATMENYTMHKDDLRKQAYIKRHSNEKKLWSHNKNHITPAYLSRHLLWNLPSLEASVKDVEKHLGIPIKNNT